MKVEETFTFSERALILAPQGRDADIAAKILEEAGFHPEVRPDIPALSLDVMAVAGVAIISDEAVIAADLRPLISVLADQPPWSDFPVVLMTRGGGMPERNPRVVRLAELLGNVTFIERPFHPSTLVSVVRTAIRSRQRQYQARAT